MYDIVMFALPVGLIVLGFAVGHLRERSHLRSLDRREAGLRDIAVVNLKRIPDPGTVTHCDLVMGEVVIGTDYFKSFASALRNLVGGEVRSLETLVTRARREAIVRMLQQARHLGAAEVYNVRLEPSNIVSRQGQRKTFAAEMLAFGTAVVRGPS